MIKALSALWGRLEGPVMLLAVIAVPIVLFITSVLAEKERTNLEYVRIAVGILQPDKDNPPQRELRLWAVQIIKDSSPVPLPAGAEAALVEGKSNLPPWTLLPASGLSFEYLPDTKRIRRAPKVDPQPESEKK